MILWKDSVDGPVQTYKLNTVTYGTTCAPYLATRTIQQLARDEGEHYPLAASVTIRDIYMDDILTEWDESLSNPIAKEWNDFVSTLPVIQNIHVPRLVIGKGRIIIHRFADASTAAYGAVLYAQSISEEDGSTRLLCSKSRVAPVKPITIPRLELCACVLLSQLLEKVLHSLTLPIQQIRLWTDSNIVLAWIQRSPEQLKTFLHNSRNPSVKRSGQLDYSEVNEAELCLIKNLQASAFQEEIEFLAKSSCNSKKASKAVHLEIVSDLTTDAFLATLKRFVARRGKCATISDNTKNFVGANRELKRLHNLLKFPEEKLSSYLSSEGISWNFMPPRAPNFGGLWEAGIEGILNSRPITPLSEDIDDLEVLTPGHFLIGRPIASISEPNLLDKTENTLSRWQKLTKIVQHIWTKWSRDYLNNLQQRNKWQFHKDNVKLNTMVLIKDDNLPVNKWSLGRITKLVPGTDGKVRVVEIKTNKGNIKRSIGKVCVLPLDN
ncbi:integrase catalytic domain-containing protein [Trichonephila clavipes]|nr:integrase catalytic domain-containing protein [Trichonephila clavipes]